MLHTVLVHGVAFSAQLVDCSTAVPREQPMPAKKAGVKAQAPKASPKKVQAAAIAPDDTAIEKMGFQRGLSMF